MNNAVIHRGPVRNTPVIHIPKSVIQNIAPQAKKFVSVRVEKNGFSRKWRDLRELKRFRTLLGHLKKFWGVGRGVEIHYFLYYDHVYYEILYYGVIHLFMNNGLFPYS